VQMYIINKNKHTLYLYLVFLDSLALELVSAGAVDESSFGFDEGEAVLVSAGAVEEPSCGFL